MEDVTHHEMTTDVAIVGADLAGLVAGAILTQHGERFQPGWSSARLAARAQGSIAVVRAVSFDHGTDASRAGNDVVGKLLAPGVPWGWRTPCPPEKD